MECGKISLGEIQRRNTFNFMESALPQNNPIKY